MNILIDIGHPAHVHLFKNFAKEVISHNHQVFFTCREKEFEKYLLSINGFIFRSFGKKYSSIPCKLLGMIEFGFKELISGLRFRPDIFLSHGSIYAAHASFFLGKPHISLEDTFNFEQIRLYKPFTNAILIPDFDNPLVSRKQIKYSGYHELAYLHPNRYSPDISILKTLGIAKGEKYSLVRFISWNASHDKGNRALTVENKIKAVRSFLEYGKVFISSESELPDDLEPFKLKIPPERIHDAIAYSSMLFGESSTMAEEAAMLGIPSIFIYNKSTYYTKHLEKKYQIMFNYSGSAEEQENAIQKGIELLTMPDIKSEWKAKRKKMVSDKIDVTAFLVWFVESWPDSFRIMKENPDYQKRFK